jgi:3-phosphoshikimate 1-carboxyvinyltransferase
MESFIRVRKSSLNGEIKIPPSKSHTIRGIIFGLLADGLSELYNPLEAQDTLSCVSCCRQLGAHLTLGEKWTIEGTAGDIAIPEKPLYVGNSGTTLGNLLAVSSLGEEPITLDGDHTIRSRPFSPLLRVLSSLGATATSRNDSGKCPITVRGPLQGGTASVEGITSIYITPFLVVCPLIAQDTILTIMPPVNEISYIKMTMNWLDFLGYSYENDKFNSIKIHSGQKYSSFTRKIPGDASSAAFPLCAAVITGSTVTVKGLNLSDPQGDKAMIDYLKAMGAQIEPQRADSSLSIYPRSLHGVTIDISDTPDLLPILCVAGCAAEGITLLENIEVTRMKESDRVKVMIQELSKMGATIVEKRNSLLIKKSNLTEASVNGHGDHRVVMALAVAGLIAEGTTHVDSAQSIGVTYPTFVTSMQNLGADMHITHSAS